MTPLKQEKNSDDLLRCLEDACQHPDWTKRKAWPYILGELERLGFTPEQIIQHEGCIKYHLHREFGFDADEARMDIREWFRKCPSPVTEPARSQRVASFDSLTGEKSNGLEPLASSVTDGNTIQTGNHGNDPLIGTSSRAGLFSADEEITAGPISRAPKMDSMNHSGPSLANIKRDNAITTRKNMVWSHEKKTLVCALSWEGVTDRSWVSKRLLEKARIDFDRRETQLLGKLNSETLHSTGTVWLFWQPDGCVTLIDSRFEVAAEEDIPDLLVGKELMRTVEKYRAKPRRYLPVEEKSDQDDEAPHGAQSKTRMLPTWLTKLIPSATNGRARHNRRQSKT